MPLNERVPASCNKAKSHSHLEKKKKIHFLMWLNILDKSPNPGMGARTPPPSCCPPTHRESCFLCCRS